LSVTCFDSADDEATVIAELLLHHKQLVESLSQGGVSLACPTSVKNHSAGLQVLSSRGTGVNLGCERASEKTRSRA
jgi:hypothetical protein